MEFGGWQIRHAPLYGVGLGPTGRWVTPQKARLTHPTLIAGSSCSRDLRGPARADLG